MKKTFSIVVLLALVMGGVVFAQEGLKGTEAPAVYGEEKKKILERQERMKRSQTIQDVARTYREMVSSYKAKRIIRAEEMAQKLDVLIDDPILPEAFASKMKRKQQSFLKRIYGDEFYVEMDVPVDDVSDNEVAEIQRAVKEETGKINLPFVDLEEDIKELSVKERSVKLARAQKKDAKQRRLVEIDLRRQERVNLKKKRREEKIALKEKRKADDIARKEKKKAGRLARDEEKRLSKEQKNKKVVREEGVSAEVVENVKEKFVADEEAIVSAFQVVEASKAIDRQKRQTQKLQEYQKQLLDLERNEIDRYVKLYEEEMTNRKNVLQEEFSKKVDSLYQDGVDFFEKKAYRFSFDVLKEVEKLHSDYKLTMQYLAELERYFKINEESMTSYSFKQDLERQQLIGDSLDTQY